MKQIGTTTMSWNDDLASVYTQLRPGLPPAGELVEGPLPPLDSFEELAEKMASRMPPPPRSLGGTAYEHALQLVWDMELDEDDEDDEAPSRPHLTRVV